MARNVSKLHNTCRSPYSLCNIIHWPFPSLPELALHPKSFEFLHTQH